MASFACTAPLEIAVRFWMLQHASPCKHRHVFGVQRAVCRIRICHIPLTSVNPDDGQALSKVRTIGRPHLISINKPIATTTGSHVSVSLLRSNSCWRHSGPHDAHSISSRSQRPSKYASPVISSLCTLDVSTKTPSICRSRTLVTCTHCRQSNNCITQVNEHMCVSDLYCCCRSTVCQAWSYSRPYRKWSGQVSGQWTAAHIWSDS